jgi:hypothetical protein
MCGYTHSTRSKLQDGEWVHLNYRRVNMTKEEIQQALNRTECALPKTVDDVITETKETSTFAFHDPMFHDAMFYASGAYAKEKEIPNTNQFMNNSSLAAFYGEHPYPTAKAEKITREESEFFKTDDSPKERKQLVENLRESIGLLEAATIIMDKVQILDPLVQGRVVNIYEQLKALTETVGSRIEYNRTKQII